MSHNCGTTCKRKTGERCETCRRPGSGHRVITLDPANPEQHRRHATPVEIGAAVDMYFDGLSYRRVAENIGEHFGRPTKAATVYRWVNDLTAKAQDVVEHTPVEVGPEWVVDELQVRLGGKKYWIFNVMDADTRFILAAYLSLQRSGVAATAVLTRARNRAADPPEVVKTDGLAAYRQSVKQVFGDNQTEHVVSKGIRAVINNNLSERLQGTFRDRDKTLRGMKARESGQAYLDGLVLNYNYFGPHQSLEGKRPIEGARGAIPFQNWRDVANMSELPH